MKTKIVILSSLLLCSQAVFAGVNLKWVGQFPAAQVQQVVDMFNQEQNKSGITVEYTENAAAITKISNGDLTDNFDLAHLKDADLLNNVGEKSLVNELSLPQTKDWNLNSKDADNRWVAILKRYRILYYNSALVDKSDVTTYESLGDEKFKDVLCLRQASAQYNTSLYSFFLDIWGADKAKSVLKSWSTNSESLPLIEKDLDGVLAGIEKGDCFVGVANTYYYLRHFQANPNTLVVPMIPNQGANDIGAHVNVDGVVMLKSTLHEKEVQTFISFLLSEKSQLLLSQSTGKFPANPNVVNENLNKLFGPIRENTAFDLNKITKLKKRALEIAIEQGLK